MRILKEATGIEGKDDKKRLLRSVVSLLKQVASNCRALEEIVINRKGWYNQTAFGKGDRYVVNTLEDFDIVISRLEQAKEAFRSAHGGDK